MVYDFLKWWIYVDGKYLLQGVNLLEIFDTLPASRVMNIIDYIFISDLLENQKEQEVLHTSRAKLDNVYENLDELNDEREQLPENLVYDIDAMDPEYVRKAQETKTRQSTNLKYIEQSEESFMAVLGNPLEH